MGEWIPLMDYAMKTGVSLSTLRRYIKANKIRYKVEQGRYLVQLDGQAAADPAVQRLDGRLRGMAAELKRAQEEIAELKTLIAFYEESVGRGGSPGNRVNV